MESTPRNDVISQIATVGPICLFVLLGLMDPFWIWILLEIFALGLLGGLVVSIWPSEAPDDDDLEQELKAKRKARSLE